MPFSRRGPRPGTPARQLRLEQLDDRIVPATQTFSGAGAAAATQLAAFTAAIGGANNAANPGTTTGFRTINWDAVGLGATDGAFTNQVITPNHTVGIPVNRFQSRGVVFADVYAVTDTGFATENPGVAGQFPAFSPTKIFAMFDDNGIELKFVVPGTSTPAATRGFGIVFLDVEKANTTSIEYFNGTTSLGKFFAPVAASTQPSFLGVLFDNPVVTNVAIKVGDGTLFSVNGATVTAGPPDLSIGGTVDQVATDDFAYAEPQAFSALPAGPTLVASGPTNGTAVVLTPDAAGQFATTPTATLNPFGGVATNLRSAAGDVNGDGVADTVLVTGPGTPVRFAVVDGKDNKTLLVQPTDPFGDPNFTGGGFVSAADLDNDGRAEILVSPDQGGGPRVVVDSLVGTTLTPRLNFFGIDDANFRGGVRTAVGDFDKDGFQDVAVAAGFLGGPRVAVFSGKTLFANPGQNPAKLIANDFFAFTGDDAVNLRNGAFIAAGDVDGDGFADLIAGGGPGGAPRIQAFSGKLLTQSGVAAAQAAGAPLMNFFVAGNSTDRGGVRVATTNADGDNRADVAVGSGEGSPSKIRVYLGKNITSSAEPTTFQDLDPFNQTLPGGVFVG